MSLLASEALRRVQLSTAGLLPEARFQQLSDTFRCGSTMQHPLVDYESLSPFVRLSRQQMQASQTRVLPLQPALKASSVPAVIHPYRISAAQSIAQQLRTRSGAAAPVTCSPALATHDDGYPASTSQVKSPVTAVDSPVGAARTPVRCSAAKLHEQAAAASPGSAVQSSMIFIYENNVNSAAHRAAVPQTPLSGEQLAAANDACLESWPDRWVCSTYSSRFSLSLRHSPMVYQIAVLSISLQEMAFVFSHMAASSWV